jgi:hypothetical protein
MKAVWVALPVRTGFVATELEPAVIVDALTLSLERSKRSVIAADAAGSQLRSSLIRTRIDHRSAAGVP